MPAIKLWLAAHNLTAPELLPYFWRRLTADVLPKLNRTLHVWATSDLSNLDPSDVPSGSVFNMYTNLGSTLNTTVARGVPAILSAPYYLDQTQSYRMGTGMRDSRSTLEGDEEERATNPMRSGSITAARSRVADPGFPNRECGTKIGHIDDIWECFYSAGPTDGVANDAAALNTCASALPLNQCAEWRWSPSF